MKIARNNVFLTGDAAGLIHPFTAEGISSALISGNLAARAISQDYSGNTACDTYIKSVNKFIIPYLKGGLRLANFYYNLTPKKRRIYLSCIHRFYNGFRRPSKQALLRSAY
jgi:flavin-dependent dehydrogenase